MLFVLQRACAKGFTRQMFKHPNVEGSTPASEKAVDGSAHAAVTPVAEASTDQPICCTILRSSATHLLGMFISRNISVANEANWQCF
jgi:hypothetical protein